MGVGSGKGKCLYQEVKQLYKCVYTFILWMMWPGESWKPSAVYPHLRDPDFFFFFFQNLQIFKKVARFCQMPCWPSKTHVQSAWGNTSDHGNAVRLKSSWQGQNVPEYSGVQTDGTHGCLHRKLETRTKPGEKPNTMNPKGGDLFSLRKGNKFL